MTRWKSFLLGDNENAVRDSYVWNALGGMLNAGQSAILLVVISRTTSAEGAGMFSIAYAIASLALMLGHYSMRNYQATDIQKKYTFNEYASSRIWTCIGMLLLLAYYLFKGIFVLDYDASKCVVIFFVVMLKLIDAVEDVFHGMFQQNGRLDIGARCATIRYILMLLVCVVALMLSHDLMFSLAVTFVVSCAVFLVFTLSVKIYFEDGKDIKIRLLDKRVVSLLKECFSLFCGGFLMIYVANAPKYALDRYFDEVVQADFTYIFMPIYVISILNSFLYQPILIKMTKAYEDKDWKNFVGMFKKQIWIIMGMLFLVLTGAYVLGVPVLSWLYNTNLENYKLSMLVLLVGSGFLAVSSYLAVVLTVMRQQKKLIYGYVVASVIALVSAEWLVCRFGVLGASLLYTSVVLLEMVIFFVMFIKTLRVRKGKRFEGN